MKIQDGTGSGNVAGVNAAGQLKVRGVSATPEHYFNHEKGQAFQIPFQVTTEAANPRCFFYFKNTDSRDAVIEGLYVATDIACELSVQLKNSGAPAGGTAVTPVNCHLNSGILASGTFEYGADLGNAASVLTGGTEWLVKKYFTTNNDTDFWNFEMDLIVPKNTVITLWSDTNSTTVTGTMVFHYGDTVSS